MERENIKKAVDLDKSIGYYEERIEALKDRSLNSPLEIRFSNKNNKGHAYTSPLGREADDFIVQRIILFYESKIIELKAQIRALK